MPTKTVTAAETDDEAMKKASRMSLMRTLLPIVGLVIIFVIFNILTHGQMIQGLALTFSDVYVTLISSMGVFFIMTMGGLDFSQGSILGIASIVICALSKYNVALAVIAGVAAGAAIGLINAFFYVKRKIKSFIVTICTMFLFRGIIKYLTSNTPVAASANLTNLYSVPLLVTLTAIVLIIGFIFFRFTRFGTDLKAIGAGETAAKFAGIKTDKTKFLIYVLAGAITGFAAFINVLKVGSATYNSGSMLETKILIALVLGGMPISGGAKVNFLNVVVGSFLYVVLNRGLQMMGLTTPTQQLIQGIIFLVFVFIFADRESLTVIK
ncbi:MAG: ABC transporter permease [Lachnospiraceae bacterium]|uniref:ABC transporter permease n=1 Tax=Candidatus Weimeria bifida TaxID=2599074 RepID=A0A6N7IY34_9FIRM|nr:ABC transporter permease [Candidatus Weimeria bifida]RRF96691.1 MAG: ABC transporter permease [Lachnospiraceae bacterium]